MNKKIKLISIFMIALFLLTGCYDSNKDNSNKLKKEKQNVITEKKKNYGEIVSNSLSKNPDELIKIIETTANEEISMSKGSRYELRKKIYLGYEDEVISSYIGDISHSYTMLKSVVGGERYKELFDKKNPRWDKYDDNNLFGISICMENICSFLKNKELENDLNRVNELCYYGLKNRDVIALVDAYRILRDVEFHLLKVPYFKDGDETIETDKNEYKIYYGASEVLEGDKYKTIGLYQYK